MKTKIRRWGINGEGVAYIGTKAAFVENAIPGETVELDHVQDAGSYLTGQAGEILDPSPRRRHPLCPKWEQCGGCALMHVDYKGQIRAKEQILRESLRRYADYTGKIEPMIKNPLPLGYRNACKLPLGLQDGHVVSGLYARESNRLVPIERCLIHSKNLEKARSEIVSILDAAHLPVRTRGSGSGLMNLVLKEFDGKVHVVLVSTAMDIPQDVIDSILRLDHVASVWQSVKEPDDPEYELFGKKVLHLGGAMKMTLQLGDLSLDLLPRSFFQLNTPQALALYQEIASWIEPGSALLVEAYSGIGAISLSVADKADQVIGIEWIEDAVANASDNALINGRSNVRFVCGDAAVEMEKITQKQHIDTLIVDPPRSGLDDAMKQAILRDLPQTMIYVSCNPATLGKDLRVLESGYTIEKVQPFDFFSQTPHVETAVLLKKKNGAQPVSSQAKDFTKRSGGRRRPAGKEHNPHGMHNHPRRKKSHQ